jgi:cellulose synthase/poly-beta-1,6-N-acetylglucosamine synthase-like glycosyltransferase
VTVVMATHNEESRIAARIRNLLAADYEADKLSIIVVDDASSDRTVDVVRGLGEARVRVIENRRQSGKAACLNQGMAIVQTDFVVFADARQTFAPHAIKRLLTHFSDPVVGAVSGALVLQHTEGGVGEGVGIYWRMERRLRLDESCWSSCIGCTGAIYGLRSALFRPIPNDTILDDVVIPMQVVLQGQRVLYEENAIALDPQPVMAGTEVRRKRRTQAGNFQMLFRYPEWLLPWRNRIWWQLFSHKYLRIFAPLFMLLMLLAHISLEGDFYRVLLVAHLLFYVLAIMGLLLPSLKNRVVSIPSGFLFLNLASIQGLWAYLGNSYHQGWKQG